MGAALWIATASFFLGQQKVFPAAWQGSPVLYLPVVAILVSVVYWFIRVRISGSRHTPSSRRLGRKSSAV
jgi:hypothetical protein